MNLIGLDNAGISTKSSSDGNGEEVVLEVVAVGDGVAASAGGGEVDGHGLLEA